jgi:hypothetical protein
MMKTPYSKQLEEICRQLNEIIRQLEVLRDYIQRLSDSPSKPPLRPQTLIDKYLEKIDVPQIDDRQLRRRRPPLEDQT